MNIFLIGFRGVGKSAVGRLLSIRLHRVWLDLDDELTREFGSSIREYVERLGWPSFRREERRQLQNVCRRDNLVVSTGGGVVLDAGNIADMRRKGLVMWLRASPETIWARLSRDLSSPDFRPPLTAAGDPFTEISETLALRTPLYRQSADLVIDTDDLSAPEVCQTVAEHLPNLRPLKPRLQGNID